MKKIHNNGRCLLQRAEKQGSQSVCFFPLSLLWIPRASLKPPRLLSLSFFFYLFLSLSLLSFLFASSLFLFFFITHRGFSCWILLSSFLCSFHNRFITTFHFFLIFFNSVALLHVRLWWMQDDGKVEDSDDFWNDKKNISTKNFSMHLITAQKNHQIPNRDHFWLNKSLACCYVDGCCCCCCCCSSYNENFLKTITKFSMTQTEK